MTTPLLLHEMENENCPARNTTKEIGFFLIVVGHSSGHLCEVNFEVSSITM
jgi:hypothetical protein